MRLSRCCAIALLGVSLGAATTGPAPAQSRAPIKFAPGGDSATVKGSVTGHDYADYTLGARAGQTLEVSLDVVKTNGDGVVYFNILPPGSEDVAIFNGSESSDGRAKVSLPADGDYTVRVYLMGNDEDTGKTVTYSLTTAIR